MKRLLTLLALAMAGSVAAQNGDTAQASLPSLYIKGNTFLNKAKKIDRQWYELPGGMPCKVPDTTGMVPIPNAWNGQQLLRSIPNGAVKPKGAKPSVRSSLLKEGEG